MHVACFLTPPSKVVADSAVSFVATSLFSPLEKFSNSVTLLVGAQCNLSAPSKVRFKKENIFFRFIIIIEDVSLVEFMYLAGYLSHARTATVALW